VWRIADFPQKSAIRHTHLAMSHLNMEQLALGRLPAAMIFGAAFLIALSARLAADASNTTTFILDGRPPCWIVGSAVWQAFFDSEDASFLNSPSCLRAHDQRKVV